MNTSSQAPPFLGQTMFSTVHWFEREISPFAVNESMCGKQLAGSISRHLRTARYSICRKCYRLAMRAGAPANAQLEQALRELDEHFEYCRTIDLDTAKTRVVRVAEFELKN